MNHDHAKAIVFRPNLYFSMSHQKRYHTENTRVQSTAEHSYRVALTAVRLFYDFCRMEGRDPDHEVELEASLYRYALLHDVDELADIPSHVKLAINQAANVDMNSIMADMYWNPLGVSAPTPAPLVKALVSMADTIEGKIVAYTIPDGEVRDEVLQSWSVIARARAKRFVEEGTVSQEFADAFLSLYRTNLDSVDPSWY